MRGLLGVFGRRVQAKDGGVPREEQVRIAREMRDWYINTAQLTGMPSSPSEFDRQLLSILDSIEACSTDIDAKIEALRAYWKKQGFMDRMWDTRHVDMLYRKGGWALQQRYRKTGRTPGMRQLRCNWDRIVVVASQRWWGTTNPMAPAWIGPEPEAEHPAGEAS